MNKKPRPWWFVCAIPVAMTLAYLGWIVRFLAGGGWNDVVEMGGWAALIGCLTFPIGSPPVIWIDASIASGHLWILSAAGYFVYVVLCVFGARKRSWPLFMLLCALLLFNVAGCHMHHTTVMLPLSP